ncbi:cytochrome P450 [Cubamyces lactineus]|nr:cytochrome P450 [Cubamyces lactineus]
MLDLIPVLWALAVIAFVSIIRWRLNPIHAIPTVGSSSIPIFSYLAGRRIVQNGRQLLQEGYKKHYGSVFKIALPDQWCFVVSGPGLVEEVRNWRDDELSLSESVAFHLERIMGARAVREPYHVALVKSELTHSIGAILPDLIDEISLAVPENINTKDSDWVSIQVLTTVQKIVARASSRVFVGLPACRNQEYLDYTTSFTIDLVNDRTAFQDLPWIFQPIAVRLFSNARTTLCRSVPILKPVIDERKAMMAEKGDAWQDKPDDLLQWIMDVAVPAGETDLDIAGRLMFTNFSSINTTSTVITIALFLLAQNPEFLEPLRTEIESLIEEEGWTKASFSKMSKVDSFLREIMRHWNFATVSLMRKALKDIKLRDGTVIPRGASIVVAADATHNDSAIYDNADQFDPFRFSRMREAEGGSTQHQFVHTSANYLSFGHGRQACPGRFFAANVIKSLLSYLLLNYDIKLGGDGPWTPSYYGFTLVPPPGSLLFRRRKSSAHCDI